MSSLLPILGYLQFGTEQNITIFLDATKSESGNFQFERLFESIKFENTIFPLTDQYFALLKFEQEYENDYSFECLVANFNSNSKYIKLVPVDCEDNIANSYLCSDDSLDCLGYITISEQLDLQFDPIFQDEQSNGIQKKQNNITDMFRRLKFSQSFQNIYSILWNARNPCFETEEKGRKGGLGKPFLRDCQWKGIYMPCSAIFTSFPTDKGMCCSFNTKAAEDIFQGETFVQLTKTLQENEKQQDPLDIGNPINQNTNPGKSKGLTVVIGKFLKDKKT